MSLSVAVVTSTQGRDTLTRCIESVHNQTYKATHYVFAHGKEYSNKVQSLVSDDTVAVYLPCANGGGGLAMAPVFAASPYLVNEDVIFYLDDDNFYDPDHIESLVTLIEQHDLGWAYSLRKIVDNSGNYLFDDNCESLGCQPNASGHYLVDNSCYAVRADVARKHSHAWYVPVVSDRSFQASLMQAKVRCGTNGKHSVSYRLSHDGSGGMSKEAFIDNNNFMRSKFTDFPWTKRQIFNY
jgi:glycosyltransferase involved in cell wall biosynthesis